MTVTSDQLDAAKRQERIAWYRYSEAVENYRINEAKADDVEDARVEWECTQMILSALVHRRIDPS